MVHRSLPVCVRCHHIPSLQKSATRASLFGHLHLYQGTRLCHDRLLSWKGRGGGYPTSAPRAQFAMTRSDTHHHSPTHPQRAPPLTTLSTNLRYQSVRLHQSRPRTLVGNRAPNAQSARSTTLPSHARPRLSSRWQKRCGRHRQKRGLRDGLENCPALIPIILIFGTNGRPVYRGFVPSRENPCLLLLVKQRRSWLKLLRSQSTLGSMLGSYTRLHHPPRPHPRNLKYPQA